MLIFVCILLIIMWFTFGKCKAGIYSDTPNIISFTALMNHPGTVDVFAPFAQTKPKEIVEKLASNHWSLDLCCLALSGRSLNGMMPSADTFQTQCKDHVTFMLNALFLILS